MNVLKVLMMLLLCISLDGADLVLGKDQKSKYTGTYSSLEYNREGGDLLGEELRVVVAKKGYQASLQIAEGEPSQLMVVDVNFDKDKIRFDIPASYSDYGGGSFEGTIDASGIKGVLTFKEGGSNNIRWKKGRGYWDR